MHFKLYIIAAYINKKEEKVFETMVKQDMHQCTIRKAKGKSKEKQKRTRNEKKRIFSE